MNIPHMGQMVDFRHTLDLPGRADGIVICTWYDLTHVARLEPYDLDHLGQVFWM